MSSLKITLIQSQLYWEDKEANLLMFEQKIKDIAEPTHLILLPEMFTTGFSMAAESLAETMEGPTVQWMKSMARVKRAVVAGSVIIREDEKVFNRLIWMLPNGNFGYYDKRHLFANSGEDKYYASGQKRFIASFENVIE